MRSRVLLAALAAGAVPAAARAHLVTTGLGPLYDGMTHLAVSAGDLLVVVALALFAGLGGAARGRGVLAVLPAAWLIGGLVGLGLPEEIVAPIPGALVMVALGALVAADVRMSRPLALALAATAGLFYGTLNGSALAAARSGLLALLGTLLAVTVLLTLASALAVSARAPWTRIVVRVAGSWIGAVGMLMAGWALGGS